MISGCSSPMIAQALSGTLLRQRMTMSFRSSFGITSNFRRIVSLLGGRTWCDAIRNGVKKTMLQPSLRHIRKTFRFRYNCGNEKKKFDEKLNRTEQEVFKTANSEKWTDEEIDQLSLEQSKRFSRIQRMNCVERNNLPENYWSDSERQDLRDRIWKEVKSEERKYLDINLW